MSSCIEFNQKYYINEDLSGKVDISLTLPKIILDLGENFGQDSIDINELDQMFPIIASGFEGISAWKDVTAEVNETDDVIHIKATLLFENINMVGGSLFFISPYVNLKDNDWEVSFTNSQMMETMQSMESNDELMDNLFDSPEISGFFDLMFANKNRYRFLADLTSVFIKQFKLSISAEFPGKVTDTKVLKVVNDNIAFLGMDGKQMVQDMYKVFDNQEFWDRKDLTVKDRLKILEDISQSSSGFDLYGDMSCTVVNPKGNVVDYSKEIETATLIKKSFNMADFDYLTDETKLYSQDGKCSIDKNNLSLDFLNDDQVIGASNVEAETYYLILKDDKSLLTDVNSLDEYHNLIVESMKQRLENGREENCGVVELNSFSGKSCELYGIIDNLEFRYFIYTVETDQDYYQLLAWTFDSNFDQHKLEMSNILSSFTVNKDFK